MKFRVISIDDPNVLLNSEYLDFKELRDFKTDRPGGKYVAYYNCLKFIVYDSGRVIVQGSLHKYFNMLHEIRAPNQFTRAQIVNGYNGNDFTLSQLMFVLNDFYQKFEIDGNSILENIEFGVNLMHRFDTSRVVLGLLFHKGKTFDSKYNGGFRWVEHQRYSVKCYNKGKQYGMPHQTLRIECKCRKMTDLNKLGISNLSDLQNLTKLNILKDKLVEMLNDVLLYDYTLDLHLLNKKEVQFMQNTRCSNYWIDLPSNRRDLPKKRLNELTIKGGGRLKVELNELIHTKWKSLIEESKVENERNLFLCNN